MQLGLEDDPGWGFRWSTIPLMFVPTLAIRRATRAPNTDPLVALRALFLTFCSALVSIGVVVVILGDLTDGEPRTGLSIALVVAAGCALLLVQRFVEKPLDCTSDATLFASYRSRFFLRLALSDAAALVGFALDIALGPWWVYFVGVGFAAIGFWRLAPTAANLAKDQDRLSLSGCQRSLVAALRTAGPSSTSAG